MSRKHECLASAVLLLLFAISGVRGSAQATASTKPVEQLSISELTKQANAGDPVAENELGVRYRLGNGVEKDPSKAIPWFRKAAQQGFAKAYFNLGDAYYNGDGVSVDDVTSCVWFMLAADAGDPRGQQAIARTRKKVPPEGMVACEVLTASAYLQGELTNWDPIRAAHWFTKAAEAGNGLACERLAYLYDRGLGVQQDKQKSINWLKRSADTGYPPALFELGMAYEAGTAVPKNLDIASALYERAARTGQPDALLALGSLYAEGRGVKVNRQEAFMFYTLAADHGSTDGKQRAEQMETQLTPEQIAAVKQEALHFVQGSGNPEARVRVYPSRFWVYPKYAYPGGGVYFCDNRYTYGATRSIYMKQSEAQQQGFSPYGGHTCQ